MTGKTKRQWAYRGNLVAVAALTLLVNLPAAAGGFRLEPGAATRLDTGERQNYTTVIITNPDAAPGRLTLGAPIGRIVEVPARGQVELYGAYGTRTAPGNRDTLFRNAAPALKRFGRGFTVSKAVAGMYRGPAA